MDNTSIIPKLNLIQSNPTINIYKSAKGMPQTNRKNNKSLFSKALEILAEIECPQHEQEFVVVNRVHSKPLTSFAKKFTNYALDLKQINPKKPRKLPVIAS